VVRLVARPGRGPLRANSERRWVFAASPWFERGAPGPVLVPASGLDSPRGRRIAALIDWLTTAEADADWRFGSLIAKNEHPGGAA
jgi:hypothetical protein